MADEKGLDEKIICVPLKDPAWMRISDVHDLPAELRDEIEHFFQVYKDLEEAKGRDARLRRPCRGRARRRRGASPRDRVTTRRSALAHGESTPHGAPQKEAVASATRPRTRQEAHQAIPLAS